jgi:glycosyltransferase involved in cell wall biosynthesis
LKSVRIALDASYSLGTDLTGVGVYSREILHGLAAAHPEVRWLWCYRAHRWRESASERLPASVSRRLLWRAPLAHGVDLFHALNQRVDSSRSRRIVSTFHDLFVVTAEYSSPEFRARFVRQAREAAARSHRIIAVSAFTARQVEELLRVEAQRIRVIPHGVHLPGQTPPVGARERLILFAGAIQKRKNLERLIDAFEQCEPGWRLILAGSQGYGVASVLDRIARSSRRSDIETPGYVSETHLHDLLSRASIFAFPSLDEGFGIPVLEAMAWGVPVLTSNRSALPEAAGDAGLLADPLDTESITRALCALTTDEALRAELRERGLSRAKRFSWEEAVRKTWDVYKELLGNGA